MTALPVRVFAVLACAVILPSVPCVFSSKAGKQTNGFKVAGFAVRGTQRVMNARLEVIFVRGYAVRGTRK